jgi:predicted O-methyltransferase YrrM
MDDQIWTDVDDYVTDALSLHDEALENAIAASDRAGLPSIQVSPPQGRLLTMLARTIGAKAILEVGTLGGYSSICLARGLSAGGRLITLEHNPTYAEVARSNLAHAGLADAVDLRVGAALDLLPVLDREAAGPFELTFIDADKVHSPDYFQWALAHSRPGSLIVVDNVVRGGTLVDDSGDDPATAAQRRLHAMIAAEPRVTATTIQTVGVKGYDGFTIALVES